MNPIQSENLARRLAELADSKKAEDIVVLDMRGLVAYTDFLAICTVRNERQAGAVVDEVHSVPGGLPGERRYAVKLSTGTGDTLEHHEGMI